MTTEQKTGGSEAIFREVEARHEQMRLSILGSLSLRASEGSAGAMPKDDLRDEAVANFAELYPGDDLVDMEYLFVRDRLTAGGNIVATDDGQAQAVGPDEEVPLRVSNGVKEQSSIMSSEEYWNMPRRVPHSMEGSHRLPHSWGY